MKHHVFFPDFFFNASKMKTAKNSNSTPSCELDTLETQQEVHYIILSNFQPTGAI